MKTLKSFSIFILLLGLTAASCTKREKNKNPRKLTEEEQHIEDVLQKASFENLGGEKVSLSDHKGKVVLFDFWETWCSPCLQVFPAMDSLQNEYPEDFVMLAVNLQGSDSPEDVRSFKENNPYDFDYLLDVNGAGAKIINVGIPFKVYFDPNGHLIKAELGTAGIEGDYRKTKVIIEENKKSQTTD